MKSSTGFFVMGGCLLAAAVAGAQAPPKPAGAPPSAAKPKPAVPAAKPAAAPAKPAAATPASPDLVVIQVGEEAITKSQFETFVESLPEQYKMMARGPAKRQVADQLASMKTLAQEARRRKLDQTPAYRLQAAFQMENLLASTLFQELSANGKIEEADSRKYYDEHKREYERAKARHILIRFQGSAVPLKPNQKDLTPEEALAKAQDLRKQLLAGADFAELAKKESDDAGSGAQGGDLGSFQHGAMVAAFEQAAFSAPLKQVTEPVKTNFGYHLILVEQREAKSYEEVRVEVEKKLRPEVAKKAMDGLKKSTTIKIDESYFGPGKTEQ